MFLVLHPCSCCWPTVHLCVLLLCGIGLSSGIYGLVAAGSISFTVCLRCEPRDLLLDTNFLRTLRAISGAADRFTASLAAGSLTCGIVPRVVHLCI